MFPVDPDIMRSQITSDVHTERRADFCKDIAVRDSEQCILTGAPTRVCEAAHHSTPSPLLWASSP